MRKPLIFLTALLLFCLFLPQYSQAKPSLIVVRADSSLSPIEELEASGRFETVGVFSTTSATPSLGTLMPYDVVLAYTNSTPFDVNALGDVLADYVDAGGKVVLSTYAMSAIWGIEGRIMTAGYCPLRTEGFNGDVSGSIETLAKDVIFEGVDVGGITYYHNFNFSHPGLDPGATLLATDGAGIKMIAINSDRNVTGLNFFPGYGDEYNNDEFFKLLINSLDPPASDTLYCSDFENGAGGFVIDNGYNDANGLWHLSSVCESNIPDPNHSLVTSLYYGVDANCNYNMGKTQGIAISPAISLLEVEEPVYLTFNYFLDTEGAPAYYDKASVEVSVNGGPFTLIAHSDPCQLVVTLEDPSVSWESALVDLSAYAGSSNINIRFGFQTVDSAANMYPGFYVDDVKVLGNRSSINNPTPYNGRAVVPIESNLTWNSCIVVPNEDTNQEGNSNNGFPFNTSSNSMRYQQFYDPEHIGSSGLITSIRFRPDHISGDAFAADDMDVEIYLGYSANPLGLESTTFASNIGPGYTKVYDGILTLQSDDTGPVPRDFDIVVDVDDLFVYNPSAGPLLLDVRMNVSPDTTYFDADYSGAVNRLYASTVSALTGTVSSSGLVTMFCFDGSEPLPGHASGVSALVSMEEGTELKLDSAEVLPGPDGSMGVSENSGMVNEVLSADSSKIIYSEVSSDGGFAEGDSDETVSETVVGVDTKLLTKTISIDDAEGTSSGGAGVYSLEVPVSSASVDPTTLVVGTTSLTESIFKIFDETGHPYDSLQTYDFSSVDFSPYTTIIVGMDGGSTDEADIAHLGEAVEQGRQLVLVGGSNWQPFVDGLNSSLIEVDTVSHNWAIVSGSPDMTLVDYGDPIASSLPPTYDFVNSSATYYMVHITDPDAKIIAENGDGYPCLVTKPVGSGKLVYFINSPNGSYWLDPSDYEILKTVLTNSLGPVCGCWDMGHPSVTSYYSTGVGTNDRGVAVQMNSTVKVNSLGIRVGMASQEELIVTIREFNGTLDGPILAQASAPAWAGGPDFYNVPIEFTFQKDKLYNISFNMAGGWGYNHNMEFYSFNNPTFDPILGFDSGPFNVLDGNGGTSGYGNTIIPHIQACVGSRTFDVYAGTEGEAMELIASGLKENYFDPGLLESCSEYNWQVVSKGCCGDETIGDVWKFKTHLSGDFYPNMHIDFFDYAKFAQHWLDDSCVGPGWCEKTDFDRSTIVDGVDLSIFASQWLVTCDCYDLYNKDVIASMEDDMSTASIDGSDGFDLWPGTFIIYKTSQGRYGKFIVENLEKNHNNRLTISWVTYNASGSVYTSGSGLVIRGTWHCDLDMGLETSIDSDFFWGMITSTERYVEPENSAKFKSVKRP